MAEAFHKLLDVDWISIPHSPYLLKYRCDEDSYALIILDSVAVFGEVLDINAILKRFQTLNSFAEMLPKVILKHVRNSLQSIGTVPEECERANLEIKHYTSRVHIHHKFYINSVCFNYVFELKSLFEDQFRNHVVVPLLLRTLVLSEEKADLQRKIELEKKQSPSSNILGSNEKKNVKAIYSKLKKSDPSGFDVNQALLFLQKDKIILPESLKNIPGDEVIQSSSSISTAHNVERDDTDTAKSIMYEEGNSQNNLESQNELQKFEKPAVSIKIEKEEIDSQKYIDQFAASSIVRRNELNGTQSIKTETDTMTDKQMKAGHPSKPSAPKKRKFLKF